MPFKELRRAISDVFHAAAFFYPRPKEDFPLYGIFIPPPPKVLRRLSTEEFTATKVTLLDVLDEDTRVSFEERKKVHSKTQNVSLRQSRDWNAKLAIEVLSAVTLRMNLGRDDLQDLEIINGQIVEVTGYNSVRAISNALRQGSALSKLIESTDVGLHFGLENNVLVIGLVTKAHNAQLEVQTANGIKLAIGFGASQSVITQAEVHNEANGSYNQETSAVVAIRSVFFGIKRLNGAYMLSRPVMLSRTMDKMVEKNLRHVRVRGRSLARCFRKKEDYWNIDMLNDVRDEDLTDRDKAAVNSNNADLEFDASVGHHEGVQYDDGDVGDGDDGNGNGVGDEDDDDNGDDSDEYFTDVSDDSHISPLINGETKVVRGFIGNYRAEIDDEFLGIPGPELTTSHAITDLDVIAQPSFWNEVKWDEVNKEP